MEEKRLLTVKEVAKMLNKTPQGIHWLIKEGRLKPESIAGKYKFFTQESIDEYIRNYRK
jgi:DNA-binding transcriptional MerR regulator